MCYYHQGAQLNKPLWRQSLHRDKILLATQFYSEAVVADVDMLVQDCLKKKQKKNMGMKKNF